MTTLFTIVGARPQFVKAAAMSHAIAQRDGVREKILHTGQHYDDNMSEVFFEQLEIPRPDHFLNIHGTSHGKMTGEMLAQIEAILQQERPDVVLVYGDTNSTLAGALAAAKLHIPLAHVEAGLRSFNKAMPEEINRILTDHMSNHLFCPTKTAVENLQQEGITEGVHHVGDIMYDATKLALAYIQSQPENFQHRLIPSHRPFALMTLHRQASTDSPQTFAKLMAYAAHYAEETGLELLFPVHPRCKTLVAPYSEQNHFRFLSPLSYFDMHYLLSHATAVLTDSGGLQKEAYFHRVPCITLRSETEWVETIHAGWNRLWHEPTYQPQSTIDDYGTGESAQAILDVLCALSKYPTKTEPCLNAQHRSQ